MAVDHWMTCLRNGLAQVIAFCFDVCLHSMIADQSSAGELLTPCVLATKNGIRQQRRGTLRKQQILKRVETCYGQGETLLMASTEKKGYSSLVCRAENNLYGIHTREQFGSCSKLHVHMDGGSYHGLNVNISMAIATKSGFATHMKPLVAPFPLKKKKELPTHGR